MKLNRMFMSPETGGEPIGQGDGGAPVEAQEPTNLPSEKQEPVSFEIKPEDLKDGKLHGRWSNPQEMADYIKAMEDKHANLSREVKESQKKQDEDIQQTAQELQLQKQREETIQSLIPEFLENGMTVTDEMREKLMATGLSETEIKLGAYEFKEALDRNASYVGGRENYEIIMNYHAQNMSDDEKRAFNHSLQNPNNHQALMVGLQAMYEKDMLNQQNANKPQDRLRGNVASTSSIKPYESKQELLRDKKYADSRVASAADKARYRARLALTPDEVWRS